MADTQAQTVPTYPDALDWGGREQWQPGDSAWFEYHCFESHQSSDAQSWYRSHGVVEVLYEETEDDRRVHLPTAEDRFEGALPAYYRIRHADGYEWTAFEDELLVSPSYFERPDPPLPRGA